MPASYLLSRDMIAVFACKAASAKLNVAFDPQLHSEDMEEAQPDRKGQESQPPQSRHTPQMPRYLGKAARFKGLNQKLHRR